MCKAYLIKAPIVKFQKFTAFICNSFSRFIHARFSSTSKPSTGAYAGGWRCTEKHSHWKITPEMWRATPSSLAGQDAEGTCQSVSWQPVSGLLSAGWGARSFGGKRLVTTKDSLMAGYYFQQNTQNISCFKDYLIDVPNVKFRKLSAFICNSFSRFIFTSILLTRE